LNFGSASWKFAWNMKSMKHKANGSSTIASSPASSIAV
jgi:hypothetical protein